MRLLPATLMFVAVCVMFGSSWAGTFNERETSCPCRTGQTQRTDVAIAWVTRSWPSWKYQHHKISLPLSLCAELGDPVFGQYGWVSGELEDSVGLACRNYLVGSGVGTGLDFEDFGSRWPKMEWALTESQRGPPVSAQVKEDVRRSISKVLTETEAAFAARRGISISGSLAEVSARPQYSLFVDNPGGVIKEMARQLRVTLGTSTGRGVGQLTGCAALLLSLVQQADTCRVGDFAGNRFIGGWCPPEAVLRVGCGDCDCKAILFASLLVAVNPVYRGQLRFFEFAVGKAKHIVVGLPLEVPTFVSQPVTYQEGAVTYVLCEATVVSFPGVLPLDILGSWKLAQSSGSVAVWRMP